MTVIHLEPGNLKAASEALARAFRDDPLQRYLFPDPVESADLSPAHFESVLKYGLLFNVPFYEHLGFRVLRHVVEPESGLPLWTFRWDAA